MSQRPSPQATEGQGTVASAARGAPKGHDRNVVASREDSYCLLGKGPLLAGIESGKRQLPAKSGHSAFTKTGASQ